MPSEDCKLIFYLLVRPERRNSKQVSLWTKALVPDVSYLCTPAGDWRDIARSLKDLSLVGDHSLGLLDAYVHREETVIVRLRASLQELLSLGFQHATEPTESERWPALLSDRTRR